MFKNYQMYVFFNVNLHYKFTIDKKEKDEISMILWIVCGLFGNLSITYETGLVAISWIILVLKEGILLYL